MAGGGMGMGSSGSGDGGENPFASAPPVDSTIGDTFAGTANNIPFSNLFSGMAPAIVQAASQNMANTVPPTQSPQASTASPTTAKPSPISYTDYYNSLVRPNTHVGIINDSFQQALGRAPTAAEMQNYSNRVAQFGTAGQTLASMIQNDTSAERARTGYQSTLDPTQYTTQNMGRPSFYQNDPYRVDYSNMFNPNIGTVLAERPRMTHAQQAEYLGNWAQKYSGNTRAATTAATENRIKTANEQWTKYYTAKLGAENKAAIDAAVAAKEAEIRQQYQNQSQYTDQSQYMTFGGKAGGSVPGGLRSLKGLTKP